MIETMPKVRVSSIQVSIVPRGTENSAPGVYPGRVLRANSPSRTHVRIAAIIEPRAAAKRKGGAAVRKPHIFREDGAVADERLRVKVPRILGA